MATDRIVSTADAEQPSLASQASASDGWKRARLGSLCMPTALVNPANSPEAPFTYVDVSSVSNESFRVEEPKSLLGRDAPSRARKEIKTNDILFATVRPTLKRVALVPAHLNGQVCSTGYCVIRPQPKELDAGFVYYFLLGNQTAQIVTSLQQGVAYPAINDSDVLSLHIPQPPLPEQRAIARALRRVQDAIQARRREVELERERKAALMQQLFTHGTRGEPTKQTEIGEMPESWVMRTLASIATCLDSKRVPVNLAERNLRPGNIPYYGASGQAGWIDDYIFDERLLLVAEDGENLVSRKLPIAYSITGKSWVNNHAHVLRFVGANQAFVEYFLNKVDLSAYLGGATRPKLNQAQLMDMRVPLPDSREQTHIADALSACDAKQVALERESHWLSELFGALLEALMTGRLSALPLIEAFEAEVRA